MGEGLGTEQLHSQGDTVADCPGVLLQVGTQSLGRQQEEREQTASLVGGENRREITD